MSAPDHLYIARITDDSNFTKLAATILHIGIARSEPLKMLELACTIFARVSGHAQTLA